MTPSICDSGDEGRTSKSRRPRPFGQNQWSFNFETLEPRLLLSAAAGDDLGVAADPLADVSAVFGASALPAALVAGEGARGRISLLLANDGDADVNQRAAVAIYASPNADIDNPNNVPLSSLASVPIRIPAGKTTTLNTTLTIPDTLVNGQYTLLADIDATDLIEESDEDNNVAVDADSFIVADPFINLVGNINGDRLPGELVSGDGTRLRVPIAVTNDGNSTVAGTADIQLYATPDGRLDHPDAVLLTTRDGQSINLRPGQTRAFMTTVRLPAGMDTDEY